ncbi:hypothetical protein SAMN04489712_14321 [Thermomonospora echinospora]|uniref:Uncharacterized protein n=1 Tax=Thermomonospora echinospora TaxID=1992 RepID=A0A1H6E8R9_9ACTN|nr:hypothetical protein [Thermomonospora echinospora]SEG94140.1 hypothetical protein SAMN04489712_14321 [Thermomonospora echinospora]
MRSREQLLEVMDRVCADVRDKAVNAAEVPERLVVVAGGTGSVAHPEGVDVYEGGGVIAFVNDSGVPFVEQAEQLIAKAVTLKPEAVLLGGSALIGRPGGAYRRILAVQLFSELHGIRMARVADVDPSKGPIRSVAPWREAKAGPPMWAEEILTRAGHTS